MEAKHTQGLWHIIDEDGLQHLCHVDCLNSDVDPMIASICHDYPPGETIANARLISAATDLLAACEVLVRRLGGDLSPESLAQEAIDFARAAIAKATGGAA